MVAWWLLAIAVCWGLLLSTRVTNGKPTPAWLLDLHRFLGGLATVFVGVHLVGLAQDRYVPFTWVDFVVPFHARWHPVALAWGVTALYLLVAIEITSLLMKRIPRRWWRRVHSTSFVLFVVTCVHVFSAGTDRLNRLTQWSGLAMGTAVLFLTVYRAVARPPRRTGSARAEAPGFPRASVADVQR
jgi:predicted ferric reductase